MSTPGTHRVPRLTRRTFGLVLGGSALATACSSGDRSLLPEPAPPLSDGLRSASGSVSMFPSPGSLTAHPATAIGFRGSTAAAAGRLTVTGSKSGLHPGKLRTHSDGQGFSFVPDSPFTPGEQVTVLTGLAVRGGANGEVQFDVSTPATETTPPQSTSSNPPAPKVTDFLTEPKTHVPVMTVATNEPAAATGLVALSAKGAGLPGQLMLIRSDGSLVWHRTVASELTANDFKLQRWKGRPVLTWWQGEQHPHGYGDGQHIVLDSSYRTVATVRAGNGYSADLHDFQLTDRGTALLTVYTDLRWDLRPYGGRPDGIVLDSIVQEVDVATGLVIFEWHALDHIRPSDSCMTAPTDATSAWDFFHVNSVDPGSDGNLLISSRHVWSLTNLDRTTGDVLWTLGGKSSDFALSSDARFYFQHDARWQPDGTITLFDDGGGPPRKEKYSRALTLRLDSAAKRVSVAKSFAPPQPVTSNSQGNVQMLSNGNFFVGWGDQPRATEFDDSGGVVWDATFPTGVSSYRAFRGDWTAAPPGEPKTTLVRRNGKRTLYVSWNGDTRTEKWRLLGVRPGKESATLAQVNAGGYEMALPVPAKASQLRVQALDGAGRVLATAGV